MHPDVVAIWAKSKGHEHLCTSESCLVCFVFLQETKVTFHMNLSDETYESCAQICMKCQALLS